MKVKDQLQRQQEARLRVMSANQIIEDYGHKYREARLIVESNNHCQRLATETEMKQKRRVSTKIADVTAN